MMFWCSHGFCVSCWFIPPNLWVGVCGVMLSVQNALFSPGAAEAFQHLSLGFCFHGRTKFAEGFVAHRNRLCLEQSYNQSESLWACRFSDPRLAVNENRRLNWISIPRCGWLTHKGNLKRTFRFIPLCSWCSLVCNFSLSWVESMRVKRAWEKKRESCLVRLLLSQIDPCRIYWAAHGMLYWHNRVEEMLGLLKLT